MGFSVLVTCLLLLILYLAYRRNRTSLVNGFLFTIFFLFLGITYSLFAVRSGFLVLYLPLIGLAVILLLVLVFGIYLLAVFLLLNARILLRREKMRLSNSLTLIAGVLILLLILATALISRIGLPFWLQRIWSVLLLLTGIYMIHIFFFLCSLLLCNLAHPPKKQDYILILGSGLIGSRVPPLLAGRIDKAIRFYEKQKKRHHPPKLLFSGGKGSDEALSEAEAMKQYALTKGIPPEFILTETDSVNTRENMLYSKKIMEQDAGQKPYLCIYATSNFHLLRAGIYARQCGLNIAGLGSRTALYYLPNALIREYIAVFWMHKKLNLVILCLIMILLLILQFLPELLANFL